ncbi:ferritin-like domain-containing protein [Streptomyces sp. NPDC008222]|uniref:ferritin-like domain-containing protein n=1 Tax=Streptomyces sp. NPDC008222 TaxID=3364820 RepID=UPI0036E79E58
MNTPLRQALLPEVVRLTIGKTLQGTLVDLLDLALVAKQAHWNVRGPGFRSAHLELDGIAAMARQQAAEVAERAATIGVSPDGRAVTIAATSGFPEFAPGWSDTDGALAELADRIGEINDLQSA